MSSLDEQNDGPWDTLSLLRKRVDVPDRGALYGGFGVLVDIAFSIVQWNALHQPTRTDALIDLWLLSDSFLMKRLAILGVSLSAHWTADRKLSSLLTNDLLYKFGLKYEVFAVLKAAYPGASAESRKALLERALRGPQPGPEGKELAAAYDIYNLIDWLQQSDPKCEQTKNVFDTLQAAHAEFGKREHADLDVVHHAGFFTQQSPTNVNDLLSKPPKEQLDYLLSFATESPFGPSREGLLETVSEGAALNYDWSHDLATELEGRAAWDCDLWPAIIRGWSRADLADDRWKDALIFLDERDKLHGPFANEIAVLLEEGVKRTSQPIPDSSLPVAADLAVKLWALLAASGGGVPEGMRDPEWVALAINHPSGRITLFWLEWLVRERKRVGSDWHGIPDVVRAAFDVILAEPAYAGQLGRVLLASQLNFFWNIDEPWTRDYLLPLFDWSTGSTQAVQALHGFLTWGRQTESLVPSLVPMYEKVFPHLAELGKVRGRFCEYLAGLAFSTSTSPMTHGWLKRFIAACDAEDKIGWASHVHRTLRSAVDEVKIFAWSCWIKEYWQQRIRGVPVPLDREELGVMVQWTLHLEPNFPEVVEEVVASPDFELKHSFLFRELAESTLPEKYPTAAAKLLLKVLQNTREPEYDFDRVEDTVRRIAPLGAALETLKQICDALANLGYPSAGKLQAWLLGHG